MVPRLTRKSGISIAIVGQCEVDTPTVQSIDRYRCRCSHFISSPFGSKSLYLDNGIGTTERFVLNFLNQELAYGYQISISEDQAHNFFLTFMICLLEDHRRQTLQLEELIPTCSVSLALSSSESLPVNRRLESGRPE
ncbi:hypothetical protein V6N13_097654 [Hibiscus sabdariffa]